MAAARVAVLDESTNGVVIVGEAGVGRTRFAEELTADVERSGHRVARATADATSSALPLGRARRPAVARSGHRRDPRRAARSNPSAGGSQACARRRRRPARPDDRRCASARRSIAGPVGSARARESGGARGDRAVRRAAARRSPVALAERPAATLRPGSARRRRGQHAVAPGPRWAGRRACRAAPCASRAAAIHCCCASWPARPRPTACSFRSTGCGR